MTPDVNNLENTLATKNHTSINEIEKEYVESTIVLLQKRLSTNNIRIMRGEILIVSSTKNAIIPIYIEKYTKQRIEPFLRSKEDTIQKNVTYDSDTVDWPKSNRTKNTTEKTMYHLPEFLCTTENIINNNCSNHIHNVDSRTEKKGLSHKNYSNK